MLHFAQVLGKVIYFLIRAKPRSYIYLYLYVRAELLLKIKQSFSSLCKYLQREGNIAETNLVKGEIFSNA